MADRRTSQSTRALLRLRQLLLDGAFAPGTRMAELALVDRLDVSRTPLRDALSALAYEGLLELLPSGGYAVRAFTRDDVTDAIELRGVLEGTLARKAAERRDVDVAVLDAINGELDGVVHARGFATFERYLELNERFHQELIALAGSPVIERSLEQVMALPFASPNAFVLAEAELPESREILVIAHHQHREIARAIERGEGARAETLGREHAHLALRNLEIVLEHRDVLATLPGASLLRLAD
ncbi:GntR family transcriptional regulator [Conexibacter woesei]|uniref:GntR family transcriptional regulator n=1 Tax=Conexibacter woesei TaxID=191495 RepID=UPI0004060DC5|nr:GntR family transcriptional regulator [Conexibacter woesei]